MSTSPRRIFILCVGAIIFAGIILIFISIYKQNFTYEPMPLQECATPVQNPYCGFFHLYGYRLSEQDVDDTEAWCQQMLRNDTQSIVLLQINLQNYSNKSISPVALQQLDTIFRSFSAADKQIILRFLYDWDGKARKQEPKHLQQIFQHMEQLAPTVNSYASHIFLLQGVFTGNCGEMNQTNYGTDTHITQLMNKLASVISPNIFLSVRTPSHLRTITGSSSPLDASVAYTKTLPARLGLYNDGIMGNVYDCGTYDDTSFANSVLPGEKGTREEEIAFQQQQCLWVPNGGEVILDNPYNDFARAYQDLARMRISYLSCDYDSAVLDKWKSSIYTNESDQTFHGCSGYEYIEAHLGYRFVLTDTSLTSNQLQCTIDNTGFAPAYRPYDTTVTFTETTEKKTYHSSVSLDTRKIYPNHSTTLTMDVTSLSLPEGTYEVTLSMKDPATGLPIIFANEGVQNDGSLPCGTLTVN